MDYEGSPKGDTKNDLKHPEFASFLGPIGWKSHHDPHIHPDRFYVENPLALFSHAFGPGKIWSGSFTPAIDVMFEMFDPFGVPIVCCGQNVFVQGKGIPWKFKSSFTPEKLFKASEKEAGSSSIPIHFFAVVFCC